MIALLRGWTDYFPFPETWSGELQRRSGNPGPAPSRRVVCEDCDGRGKSRAGWMCQRCKGKGRYAVDDYTLQPVDTVASPFAELLARFVNCDRCGGWGRLSADSNQRPDKRAHALCDDCDGTGRVPAPFSGQCRPFRADDARERIGDARLDGMALEHERRDQHPAYVALAAALDQLKRVDRHAHFLVCWVHVMGGQTVESLPESGQTLLEGAVAWLQSRIPADVRLPGELYAAEVGRQQALIRAKGKKADRFAQRKRDQQIRARADAGATHQEIAREFDVSRVRVTQILGKEAA